MTNTVNPFRLAMRVEGEWWNAYMAPPETMEGATLLATVRMTLVAEKDAKDVYLATVRDLFFRAAEAALGAPIDSFETREAPEHEKAGRA
ncbi:hypothetical protein [Dongia sp.]|uniref:hypothetical protein n=1 Tax=Dongia sp. TaxID=1977262 RepID=UPI0035AE368D